MSWITADMLAKTTRCLPVGDIVYYPMRMDPYDTEKIQKALDEMWKMKGLPRALPPQHREYFSSNRDTSLVLLPLQDAYDNYVYRHKKEPAWIKRTPDVLRGNFRAWATIGGQRRDVFQVGLALPNTQIRYVIMEGGLTERVARAFNLFRLGNVLQLANLHFPAFTKPGVEITNMRFSHTRLCHVLDAYAGVSLVIRNNHDRLTRNQKIHLRVATLAHDTLTPAHGDGTKAIDPIAFDEDLNCGDLFYGPLWEDLKRRYNLSRQLLIDTIQGKGVLGNLLNPADKIAYTARDLFWYGRYYGNSEDCKFPPGFQEVMDQARLDPFACDVWDSIRVLGDKVYFTNPQRLKNFLKLRLLLFRNLYFHPGARPIESIISIGVVGLLYEIGKLTRQSLCSLVDEQLDTIISKFLGIPFCMGSPWTLGQIYYEEFQTVEEARRRQEEVNQEKDTISFIENMTGKMKPATKFLVKTASGEIKPFFEAYPKEAEEINHLTVIEKPVFLYYIKNSRIKSEIHKLIKEYLAQKSKL